MRAFARETRSSLTSLLTTTAGTPVTRALMAASLESRSTPPPTAALGLSLGLASFSLSLLSLLSLARSFPLSRSLSLVSRSRSRSPFFDGELRNNNGGFHDGQSFHNGKIKKDKTVLSIIAISFCRCKKRPKQHDGKPRARPVRVQARAQKR